MLKLDDNRLTRVVAPRIMWRRLVGRRYRDERNANWSNAVARGIWALVRRRGVLRDNTATLGGPPSGPEPIRVLATGVLQVSSADPLGKTLGDMVAQVNDWLRFAEGKNAGLLGLASGSTLALVAALPSRRDESWLLRGGVALATLLVTLSLLVALASFLPRLNQTRLLGQSHRMPESDVNLLYYGHLANYASQELALAVAHRYCDGAPISLLHLDLAAQAVTNSRIAVGKLRLFAWAARLFGAAFVVLVATSVISVLW